MTEMIEQDYADKFPEKGWLCPYCMSTESEPEKACVDRKDIPSHLVFQHGWDNSEDFSWKKIYERLSLVGGA